ncbi:hypothetical protein RB195_005883 [Necator americanus]|uniref:ZP domain-containing protein n=1 Tax=Necator americanus TaxID=51031 RepID=A0ABR1BQ20_NECAM
MGCRASDEDPSSKDFLHNSWFLTNGAFVSTHSPHTHVDSNGFTMAPCTVESKNRNIIHRQENIMSFVEHAEDRRINSLEVSCSFKFLDTSMHITSRRERYGCRLRTLVALSRLTSHELSTAGSVHLLAIFLVSCHRVSLATTLVCSSRADMFTFTQTNDDDSTIDRY